MGVGLLRCRCWGLGVVWFRVCVGMGCELGFGVWVWGVGWGFGYGVELSLRSVGSFGVIWSWRAG